MGDGDHKSIVAWLDAHTRDSSSFGAKIFCKFDAERLLEIQRKLKEGGSYSIPIPEAMLRVSLEELNRIGREFYWSHYVGSGIEARERHAWETKGQWEMYEEIRQARRDEDAQRGNGTPGLDEGL